MAMRLIAMCVICSSADQVFYEQDNGLESFCCEENDKLTRGEGEEEEEE